MAAIGSALLAASTLLVIGAFKGFRWAVPAIVLLQVADLGIYCESFVIQRGQTESLADLVAGIKIPRLASRGDRVFTDSRGIINDNLLLLKGLKLSQGSVGIPPHKELNLNKLSSQRVAGAKWAILYVHTNNQWHWFSLDEPLPRVKLFLQATVCDDLNSKIDQIDCNTVALVSKDISISGDSPGTADIVKDAPGDIEIAADVNSRQLLFLSESFNPGWRVIVDGKTQEVIRVFGDFLGCVLEPGGHNVQFQWRPIGLIIGKFISLILSSAMLIWLLVLGVQNLIWRKNRRQAIMR
jgi:hypothetical protein